MTYQVAREHYANLSEKEIKSLKVAGLKSIAKAINIKELLSKDIKWYRLNKKPLQEAILAALKPFQKQEISDNYKDEIINKCTSILWNGDKQTEGLKSILTFSIHYPGKYNERIGIPIGRFRGLLENQLESIRGSYANTTLLDYKAAILKELEDKCKSYFGSQKGWRGDLQTFYHAINHSFKDLSVRKCITTAKNFKTRRNNGILIDVTNLIKWSESILENLRDDARDWQNVAVALMICTGRRQSEIMSSARFELIEGELNWINFEGQLKRHDNEDVEQFAIPTLCDPSLIIDGIDWLEKYGKREENAKKAHKRFSPYLSKSGKNVCSKFIGLIEGSWFYEADNGKQKDRKTCHIFRQIYGQVCYLCFAPKIQNIAPFLTRIMGHADTASSRDYAAGNYDADIKINNSRDELRDLIL